MVLGLGLQNVALLQKSRLAFECQSLTLQLVEKRLKTRFLEGKSVKSLDGYNLEPTFDISTVVRT
jgi:hypothetical protein